MKRFLTIVLASVLLFAVTAPAMAMHAETFGSMRVRHWATSNFFESGESDEWFDQRFRLTFKWGLSETSGLKMRADFNEGKWGSKESSSVIETSTDPFTGVVTPGSLETAGTKKDIHVDQMYGWLTFPGTPVTLTIGKQPVGWGTGILASGDNRDRIKLAIDVSDTVYVDFTYDQSVERHAAGRADSTVDDSRSGGPVVVVKVGDGWEVGGVYVYVTDKDLGAEKTEHIVGGFVTGKAGPVSLKFDGNYLTGEVKNGTTKDESGLILYAGAFINAGPAKIGLEGGYAQGDEASAGENEGALKHDLDGPMKGVVLFNDGYGGWGASGDSGLANATMVKVSAKFKAGPKVTVKVAALYATADEATDTDMGFELDGGVKISLVDHVSYSLDVGFLAAGDYFGSVDDPVVVSNKIQFDF